MILRSDAQISAGGKPLASTLLLSAVEVDLVASGISSATLTLVASDRAWGDLRGWLGGGDVSIGLKGSDGALRTVFEGEIARVRTRRRQGTATQTTVVAWDKLHRLGRAEAQRVLLQTSDGELLSTLVSGTGLSAATSGQTRVHPSVVQGGISALDLLRERAARVGGALWIEGDTVHLEGERSGATVEIDGAGELVEWEVSVTASAVPAGVLLRGWDPDAGEARLGIASAGDESAVDRTLSSGPRDVAAVFPHASLERADLLARSQGESDALAAGLLQDGSMAMATARGRLPGRTDLAPGGQIKLTGVPAFEAGTWRVSRVWHRRDKEGFYTRFEAQRNHGGGA